ncbi:MAG: amino acid adenylation domain-containing protein [bacterium]|nr:amino acid adenylation domain-containing protein [bacterium]
MSLESLFLDCLQQGAEFWAEGDRLRFRAPDGVLAPEILERLKKSKAELLDRLSRMPGVVGALSPGQRALWFLHQFNPASPAYNVAFTARIEDRVDSNALSRVFQAWVDAHPMLRASYPRFGSEPVRLVSTDAKVDFNTRAAEGLTEERLHAMLVDDYHRPFDLTQGPVMRITLYSKSPGDHLLLIVLHHIASDAWSFWVLMDEFQSLYPKASRGEPLEPNVDEGEYARYALQRNQLAESERGQRLWEYWRNELNGAPQALQLPCDYLRPPVHGSVGASLPWRLDGERAARIKAFANDRGVTLFVLLLAVYQTLLHRCSRQDDILVGGPVSGRSESSWSRAVGYFVNPVVFRSRYRGDATFVEFLTSVRDTVLAALDHQDFPFPILAERLQTKRDPSRTPLFQVAFTFQQLQESQSLADIMTSGGGSIEWGGLRWSGYEMAQQEGQFDLMLEAIETPRGIHGMWKYNTEIFAQDTINRCIERFDVLLDSILNEAETPLERLPLLSPSERASIGAWNQTGAEFPVERLIHHGLEKIAASTPDAVALRFEGQSMTYGELSRRINQLAYELRKRGVGPDVRVGVCLERSFDMVIALYGVLKAGGAYVPLDPDYPAERLAYIIDTAQAGLIVTRDEWRERLPARRADILSLDRAELKINPPDCGDLEDFVQPENLAYIIFTSGSTGWPKGVMIDHRAVCQRVAWMQRQYPLSSGDRFLLKTPYGFDVSVFEFFWPLNVGAQLVIANPSGHRDPSYLVDAIQREGVSAVNFVPSMLKSFLSAPGAERCTALRLIFSSGEALPYDLMTRCLKTLSCAELHNLYGPTETTVDVSYWQCRAEETRPLAPIGRPYHNNRLYVLDRNLSPCPAGTPGELYIAGPGLARGYVNRPDITAEAFLPDPWSSDQGGRMYKTGDAVRWLPDGNVEYLGRLDHQVKIRGFRIELGEIEAALLRHSSVREALVRDWTRPNGDVALAAYLVFHPGAHPVTTRDWRYFLRDRLPEYMIPADYVVLESFPVSPNGKIDRKTLPEPTDEKGECETDLAAPSTPTEDILLSLWKRILSRDAIGIHDDFFELGGHSLLATRLASWIRDSFSVEIPLQEIFEGPTISSLARWIDEHRTSSQNPAPVLRPISRDGLIPLSFAQKRLWFLSRMEPDKAYYNEFDALRLCGVLNLNALVRALNEVARRHEILRTTFQDADGEPVQVIHPALEFELRQTDCSNLPESQRDGETHDYAARLIEEPFDLEKPPLWRAALICWAEDDHVLVFVFHHIISDGWSFGVLVNELSRLYKAYCQNESSPLAELPVQYADYAIWQRGWLTGKPLKHLLDYWKTRLQGAPSLLELPLDHPRPPVQRYQGKTILFPIDSGLANRLKALAVDAGSTLHMVLHAVLAVFLYRYSGLHDFCIAFTNANRNRKEIESLFGLFVNTLVLRVNLNGMTPFDSLLQQIHRSLLEAYDHQDLPFEQLVEAMQPQRSLSHNPLVQVMLILQNAPIDEFEMPGLAISRYRLERPYSRYDLMFSFTDWRGEMAGELEYNIDLWDESTARRMIDHFLNLLREAVRSPQSRVESLRCIAPSEREIMRSRWDAAVRLSKSPNCVYRMIETQAAARPDNIGLVRGERRLTYREINQRANRLARLLIERGVRVEDRVAVLLNRTEWLPIALLAVMKAGAAYIPIDPAWPDERTHYVLSDAGVRAMLMDRGDDSICLGPVCHLALSSLNGELDDESPDDLVYEALPESLAYVIYTSGSTGKPKGVEVTHGGLSNLLSSMQIRPGLTASDRMLFATTAAFDMSVPELYLAWSVGARMILLSREEAVDPERLIQIAERETATVFQATPASYRLLLSMNWRGSPELRLWCGGEALPVDLARSLLDKGAEVWNLYGPTETTVWSTGERILPEMLDDCGAVATVGKEFDNTRVYVLDESRQLVPDGVAGEVCIAGAGLARGYLHRPAMTAERFAPDPFGPPGARMYCTGDIGRIRADGRLEYIGRADDQIKIRGYRIELGEIENALKDHEWIDRAAAVVSLDRDNDARLIAFIVPASNRVSTHSNEWLQSAIPELEQWLRERLPEYMIPTVFIPLNELPYTPNRKLDRKALLRMYAPAPARMRSAPPSTPLERTLAHIWREVLNAEEIGVNDDFFRLGGHSLLAARLTARIQKVFQIEFPLRGVFEAPTIAGLAKRLAAMETSPGRMEKIAQVYLRVAEMSSGEAETLLQSRKENGLYVRIDG